MQLQLLAASWKIKASIYKRNKLLLQTGTVLTACKVHQPSHAFCQVSRDVLEAIPIVWTRQHQG